MVKGTELRSLYIYPTKKAAEIAEAEAVAEYLRTGRLPTDPPETHTDSCPTVLELLNERISWVELHRTRVYASDHKYCFRRVLERAPEWAKLSATAITVEMVEAWAEDWAADLLEQGKTRHQVNAALTLLEATWNKPWGAKRKEREFPRNPFALVERYSVEKKAKYLPTDAQVAKVLMAAPPKGRLLMELMLGTGARPSEAVELQWFDVQADQEPYSVVLYTRKKRGGTRTPRRVTITPELAAGLRSWRKGNPDSHYVFQQPLQSDGEQKPLSHTYSWARRVQEKACRAAGVSHFSLLVKPPVFETVQAAFWCRVPVRRT
ncbi:MAG: site-specific integrase, partial [Proteobacteria bacterium]|nr:site-specific integrase [Pseudomonadota bacterium]